MGRVVQNMNRTDCAVRAFFIIFGHADKYDTCLFNSIRHAIQSIAINTMYVHPCIKMLLWKKKKFIDFRNHKNSPTIPVKHDQLTQTLTIRVHFSYIEFMLYLETHVTWKLVVADHDMAICGFGFGLCGCLSIQSWSTYDCLFKVTWMLLGFILFRFLTYILKLFENIIA